MPIVYLSIGSNLGKRYENCQNGISQLIAKTKSLLIMKSPFYETEPVGYEKQGWFLNAVIKIETLLDPSELLRDLKSVESDLGRNFQQVRFGPRTLDLDILFYDNLIENGADLVIPHPRMHERRFVLKPLCDIAPAMIHPILKKSVTQLLKELEDSEQMINLYK